MDIGTVTEALRELRQHRPHLPMPEHLAATVTAAWNEALLTRPGFPAGPMAAVVAASWPVGVAAGAQRGHQVALSAIRSLVAQALTDPVPDPAARWVIWACARAADTLPAGPDVSEVTGRIHNRHLWVGDRDDLDVALALGLGGGWLAGHRDATDRLVEAFVDHVTELVGAHELTTTFLNAHLNGDDVVHAISLVAFHTAERDQDHPAPSPAPSAPGRAVGRAFVPLAIDPASRGDQPANPSSHPDRGRGTSR